MERVGGTADNGCCFPSGVGKTWKGRLGWVGFVAWLVGLVWLIHIVSDESSAGRRK